MEDTITTTYCLCEEFLKAIGHHDDPQTLLSTAEVMTVALVACASFGSNIERSRLFLHEHGYMPKMLSKSRLNRRLHAIPISHWEAPLWNPGRLLQGARAPWGVCGGLPTHPSVRQHP